MPKFQYIGEPFSRENPGTVCEFMEVDAIEMRKPSNVYWVEVTDVYHDGFVPSVKKSIKEVTPVLEDKNTVIETTGKKEPLPAFTKEQAVKRTLSPEHLAKLKAGRDAKRAE